MGTPPIGPTNSSGSESMGSVGSVSSTSYGTFKGVYNKNPEGIQARTTAAYNRMKAFFGKAKEPVTGGEIKPLL